MTDPASRTEVNGHESCDQKTHVAIGFPHLSNICHSDQLDPYYRDLISNKININMYHTRTLGNRSLVGFFIACTALFSLFVQSADAAGTGSLMPSADGTYTNWSLSAGGSHYVLVDESSCNGTTDYVRTTTVGDRDSYAVSLASIPNGSTITAIGVTPCASRDLSGGGKNASSKLDVFYRHNGSNGADAGSYNLTGTTPTNLSATTWSNLSLSKDSNTVLEVGVVYSAGNKGVRVSRVATVITYTEPVIPPTVTTSAASSVTLSAATLNGEANPNGEATTGWFRYSVTDPGTCNDSFGTRTPVSGGTSLGGGISSVSFNESVSGLSNGTTYYYCALASNSGGTSLGNVASFTTADLPPAAPTGFSATNISGTENSLSWTDNSSNETGFFIERAVGAPSGWSVVGTTSANVTSFNDTGAAANQTYYYRVRAYNMAGNSSYSNNDYSITATAAPAAPTSLNNFASSSLVFLWWTDSSTNEEGFSVERSTDGVNWTEIGTANMNYDFFEDVTVTSGNIYYYRVRGVNAVGAGSYSTTTTAVL